MSSSRVCVLVLRSATKLYTSQFGSLAGCGCALHGAATRPAMQRTSLRIFPSLVPSNL